MLIKKNEEPFFHRFLSIAKEIIKKNSAYPPVFYGDDEKLYLVCNNYAAGDTSIFLIRKRENVNHPYYTLELKRNEVIQLRGKNNCRPTDSVVAFVNKWAKKNKLSGAYIN